MSTKPKEKRFLNALEALFTGADVDGDSGYINLMQIKREYFKSTRQLLLDKIDERTQSRADFREELFDKLYTFFSHYFCESGSIYFRHLPAFSKTYERVYEGEEDVALAWKTRMLYYVKSDVLVRSMPVELQDDMSHSQCALFFDASKIEHCRNNERREFVFKFSKIEKASGKEVVHLTVQYSQNGARTNLESIVKEARKNSENSRLTDRYLRQAIQVFKRQTEADFFIHKDARGFLREQLDLWMYQYLFQEETVFGQQRLSQLQAIQRTAYDIIDFIAQFEDELRRVWEKPKFVRNVNYVVTLDKIPSELLERIIRHKGGETQVKEWWELDLVDKGFSMTTLDKGQCQLEENGNGPTNGDYRFLPLDTRHFKDLELEILDALGNLDEVLDGELVHSENWQALNTLSLRHQQRVECIHIDPPYNTRTSGFLYRNEYQHASWLTMMENRVRLASGLISESGSFLCHIDEHEYERLQLMMDGSNLRDAGTIIWDKKNPMMGAKGIATQHEYILWRTRHEGAFHVRRQNIDAMLAQAEKLVQKYDEVNEQVRKEFSRWVDGNEHLSGGERAYRHIDENGRVYRGVAMGWPNPNPPPEKFFIPLIHPVTKRPCPVPNKGWSHSPEKMQGLLDRNEILFGKDETVQPTRKVFLSKSRPISTVIQNGKRGLTDIDNMGLSFSYCHPVSLYEELIDASLVDKEGIVLDYFAGSGTTAHATINLNRDDGGNRKYLLVEMGDYFYTVLLPRVKKAVFAKRWKDGKPIANEGSSQFFKYYTLEQYEETLKNSHYKEGMQLELDSTKSPFEQYVFFGDEKMAYVVTALKNKKLKINLKGLYPDIDIAESISNIIGKPIQNRTADEVVFTDGSSEKINPKAMTEEEKLHFVGLIKPYLWWGEDESV